MRTLTIEKNVYSYSDLLLPENSELKQKVLEKLSDINTTYDWYECVYDNFKENIAPELGFQVDRIYFSGFYSQGDGAMFEGYVSDFTKFIKDTRIKRLLENESFYLSMEFKQDGRYYHEKSYNAYLDNDLRDYDKPTNIQNYIESIESIIKIEYEGLCKQLYRMLEKEHDYHTSEEQIMETIESNGYEFDCDGNIA